MLCDEASDFRRDRQNPPAPGRAGAGSGALDCGPGLHAGRPPECSLYTALLRSWFRSKTLRPSPTSLLAAGRLVLAVCLVLATDHNPPPDAPDGATMCPTGLLDRDPAEAPQQPSPSLGGVEAPRLMGDYLSRRSARPEWRWAIRSLRTAMAMARRVPTNTTSFWARVTAV
jgi:hypothetical protein